MVFKNLYTKSQDRFMRRSGIEPDSPRWQRDVLTDILATRYNEQRKKEFKKIGIMNQYVRPTDICHRGTNFRLYP